VLPAPDIDVARGCDENPMARRPGAEEAKRSPDVLSTVSHQLRTPLTAIRGFADLLTQDWDGYSDDEKHEFLHRIALAGSRLDDLIAELLDRPQHEPGTGNP
jgi:signal transduction histidine kinase